MKTTQEQSEGTEKRWNCPHCGEYGQTGETCEACGLTSEDPRLGRVVAGRVRIDSLLGAGGFGRVYVGTHLTLGGQVAVKFLLSEGARRPESRARFRREAMILSRVRHPGIVGVHDFGEQDGECFMVMEFCEGKTLDHFVLQDGNTMPLARLLPLADQILQVLEAAHGEGIVHRDLKPENIMMLHTRDRTDRVKVLDFGLALGSEGEIAHRVTSAKVVQGTPLYMSPEQCRAQPVGEKSDVYSFGIMLYEMVAGDVPFMANSGAELLLKHMMIEPPPMSSRGTKNTPPEAVENLVRWALAKEPDARPTAAEMRDVIREIIAGSDPFSRRRAAEAQRGREALQSRDERALAPAARSDAATVAGRVAQRAAPRADGPAVVLWGFDLARSDTLADVLAMNGIVAVTWSESAAPPATVRDQPVRCIVTAGDETARDRLAALKNDPATARLAVIVADVQDGTTIPSLIRAGAADVLPAQASDDIVGSKILKTVSRRR